MSLKRGWVYHGIGGGEVWINSDMVACVRREAPFFFFWFRGRVVVEVEQQNNPNKGFGRGGGRGWARAWEEGEEEEEEGLGLYTLQFVLRLDQSLSLRKRKLDPRGVKVRMP